jgi:hypothetical protein
MIIPHPVRTQSDELTRGPPDSRVSLAVSFIGGVRMVARALHVINLIWFGYIAPLAFPSGEEGGNFLFQIIFTCLRYAWGVGGRSAARG